MMFFVVFSLLQNFPIIGIFPTLLVSIINICCIILTVNKLSQKNILVLLFLTAAMTLTIIRSNDLKWNIKDVIYFATFILLGIQFSKIEFLQCLDKYFKQKVATIKWSLAISNIILLVGLFSSHAYYYDWGENDLYYKGFTYMPHVVAALCTLLMIYTIYYIYNSNQQRIKYMYLFLPIVCILKSGARIFLVPVIIIVFLVLLKELKILKTIGVIVLLSPIYIYIFLQTSIYSKFMMLLNLESSNSLLSRLTSGRSDMWSGLMYHYFFEYNFLDKLIGTSFDNVYSLNYLYSSMSVWAHNDGINTLISCGILGLLLYLYIMYSVYKVGKKMCNSFYVRCSFIVLFGSFSFLNGLYILMPLVFSIPFFWITFKNVN